MWPGILEIPVTTMPIFRVPFHISYILYLSTISPILALAYFQIALALCRLTQTQPSLLLHPLDFLSNEDIQELSFFPAMGLPTRKKISLVGKLIDTFCRQFIVVPLKEHVYHITQMSHFMVFEPNFGGVGIGADGEPLI